MTRYGAFDEYVANQPEACRTALRELRLLVLEAAPSAGETFNYNIPAYALTPGGKRDQQIMIAGYKRHVGLYPHPTTMEHFADQLAKYKTGKGSVQFPVGKPLPRDLILEMVKYRLALVTGL